MFRDKPSTYDRLADTLSGIGDRLAELEEQAVERFNPAPSRAERIRRSISRNMPFHHEPTGVARYLPDFMTAWSMPSTNDARRHMLSLRDSAGEGVDDARGYFADARRHLPDIRLPRFASFRRGMETERGLDYLRNRPELTALLVVGGAVAVVGTAYYVTKKVQDHAEEPDYDVVREDGTIEIRDYDAMVVAETIKSGYHEKARRAGFETLADYIFARNREGKKIKMTTPVLQQLAEGDGRTKGWAVRFVMPKKHTLASLPKPADSDVTLKDMPARRMAAIRFSGNFSATLASKQLMNLYNYLADNNLKQKGDPQYAFYNPPWTPGFMKRNEILIEIER
ncbi:heme-binding protein [Aurantimonas aggregata]|uniref:Heme-binding protein n=1 Tax=Aurantimonas aggregata TaxID=2047720 RepID=A0A6L9MGH8_9HYPH|nr:heme-binding protein [Aurantimonas aggregata]NDV86897.1 heme-binding protein [Aurantimonas aggregata]